MRGIHYEISKKAYDILCSRLRTKRKKDIINYLNKHENLQGKIEELRLID